MLGDNDFYIFMIWNKSFASTNKIYDLKKNVMFEDKDITVKIIGQNEGLDEFIKNAKDMVKPKSYAYGGQSGYGGYYNQGYRVKRTMERNPEPELELVGMDRMLAKNRCMAGKTKMTTTLMHT